MDKRNKLSVSHAPFWHNGSKISRRNCNVIFALFPAIIVGLFHYRIQAIGVVCLSVSSAIIWEILFTLLAKKPVKVDDGSSALIGLLFAALLPASAPWWFVIVGTFIAVVIGVQIFGGIGGNPFNPVALSISILAVSWKNFLDLNEALLNFNLNFSYTADPLTSLKYFGASSIENLSLIDLFLGRYVSTIGSASSVAIILGGSYLIAKGIIRWEITLSFLVSVYGTALAFNILNPVQYADPLIHLLTGFTMIGAFFLATEDSSSPVNFIPMLVYGTTAGIMTVLIRNIGLYIDGVVFAILIANLINPIVDKIKPKTIERVV